LTHTQYSQSGRRAQDLYADNAIFVTGGCTRPIIGKDTTVKLTAQASAEKRRNQKLTEKIQRLEVSKSADMAWEFADFRLSYDETKTGKHVEFPGSMLRVWKKVDGRWRVIAEFRRPNEEG
jgi:ketosteroid isomerase-like protein